MDLFNQIFDKNYGLTLNDLAERYDAIIEQKIEQKLILYQKNFKASIKTKMNYPKNFKASITANRGALLHR